MRGNFDEIFCPRRRRLFISCFSSSIHRIKLAFEMAREYKRKDRAGFGRSMTEASEIAMDLGSHSHVPEGLCS